MINLKYDNNTAFLVLGSALRYALPRKSYIVTTVLEAVERHAFKFPSHQIDLLVKDIQENLNNGRKDYADLRDAKETALHNLKVLSALKREREDGKTQDYKGC